MESDIRYYRRRANEELAAAGRAVTVAARDRRMQLADIFLERLNGLQPVGALEGEFQPAAAANTAGRRSAFDWIAQSVAHRA